MAKLKSSVMFVMMSWLILIVDFEMDDYEITDVLPSRIVSYHKGSPCPCAGCQLFCPVLVQYYDLTTECNVKLLHTNRT